MKKFQVITDSTSDLEKKFRDELDIDYFKMVFTIEDIDYEADLDWTKLSPKEYYGKMREGKRSVTSLPSRLEFETKFKKYLDQGLDVFYVACSCKLSGSRNYSQTIVDELKSQYPDRTIICLDTKRSCYSEGMIAMDAAKMANEGKTINEALDIINTNLLKYQVHAIVGSLEWLRKAGRVKASTAFFGNMIGIKPVICSDSNGNNYAYEKVVGRRKSIDRLIDIVAERIENASESTIYVEHADSDADCEYVVNQLKAKINPKAINVSSVGPIIGATVGPDTITISFFGKEIDFCDPESK